MVSARSFCVATVLGLCAGVMQALAQSASTTESSPAPQASAAAAGVPAAYPGAETPLGQRVAALLADPAVSRAHWGVAVTALDGAPLYGLNEAKLFRPASTAKLFTTAAAVTVLGPDKTWTTTVRGDLDPSTGVVKGDLVLVGAGDPDFSTADVPYLAPAQRPRAPSPPPGLRDLEQLADQLVQGGVKQVTGGVIGDDMLFPYEPFGEGWSDEDAVWGYGAPVSALSLADNQLTLTATPGHITGAPGHEIYPNAAATLEQYGVPYYTVQAEVRTSDRGAPGAGVQVERATGSRTVRVYGAMPEGSPADVEHIAIDDPAAFAAMALRQMLLSRGIRVAGPAQARHQQPNSAADFLSSLRRPPDACETMVLGEKGACGGSCLSSIPAGEVLASHASPPLLQDVVFTAKVSENLHAEVLLHQLGRVVFCGQGSTLQGARMVRAFAIHAGVSPDDFLLYDGSGLSAKDVVTPRAEAQLLAYAARQPWFAEWKAALPVGGIDGTLSGRFKEAPGVSPEVARLKGKVFAKTGTLGESRALAGYLQCASGRTVVFSILVDNHLPGTSADREAMDRIVAAIADTQ